MLQNGIWLTLPHHIGSTHAFHATIGQNGPKLGGLGLYIRSKQRSEIELICDNRLVIYNSNMQFFDKSKNYNN